MSGTVDTPMLDSHRATIMKPFPNAPLLEVVAELHWRPVAASANTVSVGAVAPGNIPVLADGTYEQFFGNLATRCAERGFARSERLVPLGFPTLPHQAVYRFRSQAHPSELYQAGVGMFSVNGLRPYTSWEAFQPVIAAGVDLLFESRVNHVPSEFTEILLKYVNLFDATLLEDRSAVAFSTSVAGMKFELPPVFEALSRPASKLDMNLALNLPLAWGAQLRMRIGDGKVADNGGSVVDGVVMDTTISIAEDLPTTAEGVLNCFNRAHADIQQIFLEMTKPIHKLMLGEDK